MEQSHDLKLIEKITFGDRASITECFFRLKQNMVHQSYRKTEVAIMALIFSKHGAWRHTFLHVSMHVRIDRHYKRRPAQLIVTHYCIGSSSAQYYVIRYLKLMNYWHRIPQITSVQWRECPFCNVEPWLPDSVCRHNTQFRYLYTLGFVQIH